MHPNADSRLQLKGASMISSALYLPVFLVDEFSEVHLQNAA
jgi:hypothetical protein